MEKVKVKFKSILVFIMMICTISSFATASEIDIKQEAGKLTANIDNAKLKDVLQKLSEQCDATVFVDVSIQDKIINARIKNMPVEKAIKRLVSPYSSVAVFSQRINDKGKKELYISDIKVFESSKAGSNVEYVNVSAPVTSPKEQSEQPENDSYQSPFRVPPPVPGVHAKGSYGEMVQKAVNDHMVESRIKKISYMRAKASMEENNLRREITQLKMTLTETEGEKRKDLSSELSAKTRELYNLQQRNQIRLQNEERILRQLQSR